ncbi:hypothetical protein BSZ19_22050 [Bradyrhizobium japonicum]|uniref:DUF6876 domain-containing protein n=1 Tax=Bradyrhizobium japonicum TaxID=375 RepID=A0A1Y2JQC4_BRAJP|nr:DUF6876 family protein [Bradyrhizobium japonicum]OSJ31570.1 hypothetical protein BSZ19_22050 [Bradyrhizobium japonicum]
MSKLTHADLRQFTGSEQVFRHSLMRSMTYTEGVQYLAESGGAYWLIDKVACLQLEPKVKAPIVEAEGRPGSDRRADLR